MVRSEVCERLAGLGILSRDDVSETGSIYFPELSLSSEICELKNLETPLLVTMRYTKDDSRLGMILFHHSSPVATVELNGLAKVRSGDSFDSVEKAVKPYIIERSKYYLICRDDRGQTLILNFVNEKLMLFALGMES